MADKNDVEPQDRQAQEADAQAAFELFGLESTSFKRYVPLDPSICDFTTSCGSIYEDAGYPFGPEHSSLITFDALGDLNQPNCQDTNLLPNQSSGPIGAGLPTPDQDNNFETVEDKPTEPPAFVLKWNDLTHVGKSVVLSEFTKQYGSIQKACELLLLLRDDAEKWLSIHRHEQEQERQWKLQLVRLRRENGRPSDIHPDNGGPVETRLLTTAEMYKASKFVATLGYSEIATKIITCSHKKVGWPLPIDISTFNPSKIHDGSFANIDNNHHASPPHFSWDVIDEEDDVDHEELVAYPVRALFSIALTDPKIKAKNNIRLMTCILPRGTVVVGPGGRQVLDEAGEYRICPPSDQTTPVEDDTQLDFVTDDVTLTSFASQHVHQSDNNHRAFAPITNDNNKPTSARSLITGPISDIDSREAVEHNGTTNTIQSNITRQPSQTVMSKFQGNISESKHMFERIMDKLSIKPDWAAPDGRWNPTKNRLTYDSSRTEFFENSMTSSELPSPRMSIQIIPACSGSVPSPKARSVFELRMLQAYQKLLVEGVTAVKHRTHPLERLTKISTLGRNISEVEPETMVQEAFAAACPKTSPDEVRDRYINHIYERQELRCQSLSRLHRIKDAAFAESNEFGFSVREAYPAGKRPEINAVGPVERASTPASKVDQMDLAFMTLPMPPGCAIISPSGYVMNLDTFHRGPVDGEAPLGQGGIYSFFLPQMAKHLAADFQPWLHDWVGFKFCFPQAIGLVLHGKWLPRWTTSGAHQIVEVDGELDLLSPKGRYRLFNGMQPIGTPVNKEPRTADIPGMVMQEAQQILRQYKQDPLKDIKREQFQEARQINIDKLASKRLQTTLSKQKEQGQLQYDISGEISDLLEEDSEDADSASSGGNFDPRQHKAEKKLKGQVKEKKKILITLRTTPQQLAGATGQPLQSGSVPTRSYERKSIVPIVPSGSGEEETDTKRGSSPHGHNHEMIHSSTQIDVPSTRQCRQINNIPKSQPKTLHIKRKVGNVSWDEDEIEMAETPSKKSTAYVRQDTKIVRLSTRSTKFTRKTSDRVGDLKATPRQTNVSVHDVSSQSGQPSSGSTTRRRNGRPVIPSTMGGAMVQQARMLPFLPKAVPTSLKTIAKKPQSLSSECTIKASQATGVKPIVRLPPKLKYDLKSARKIDTSDKLSEHVTKSHAPFLPAKPPSTTYSSSYNDDEERCTRSSMPKAFGSYAANLQQLAVGTTRAVPPLDPSSMMISDQRFGHAVSTTPSTAACIKQQSTPNLPSGPPPIVGPPPQSAPSAHNTINGQQSIANSRFPSPRMTTKSTANTCTIPAASNVHQIPSDYPQPTLMSTGHIGYLALNGSIFMNRVTAVHHDRSIGNINDATASGVLVRIQQNSMR